MRGGGTASSQGRFRRGTVQSNSHAGGAPPVGACPSWETESIVKKRKNESQLVKVEDFYRRCLQGTKPRLGQVASKHGSRVRRKRRIAAGSRQATLQSRLRGA